MHQQNVKIMTQFIYIFWMSYHFKWIVHFEITFWYVLAYLKGIQEWWLLLFVVDPIYLHYMTGRQERFDLKISKLKLLWKQRHIHLGCPWCRLKLMHCFLLLFDAFFFLFPSISYTSCCH